MNRRGALKATGALVGSVLLGSSLTLGACTEARPPREVTAASVLSADDQTLVEDVADTILPTTPSSPGAKAAGVGRIINLILTDCYDPEKQQRLVKGLAELRATCTQRYRTGFTSLGRSQREALLRDIDTEAQRVGDSHWFSLARELSLGAYFSSEIGMTKALRYVRIPGKYVGCMPLEPHQPAWG